jgi:hypothetical protein
MTVSNLEWFKDTLAPSLTRERIRLMADAVAASKNRVDALHKESLRPLLKQRASGGFRDPWSAPSRKIVDGLAQVAGNSAGGAWRVLQAWSDVKSALVDAAEQLEGAHMPVGPQEVENLANIIMTAQLCDGVEEAHLAALSVGMRLLFRHAASIAEGPGELSLPAFSPS